MTEDQSSIEELNQKKQSLENEISSLESQLQISLEKEKLHQSTLSKIKKIQSEYEQSYLSSLNDYKNRENSLKSQFLNYQNLLEKQYNESEKRLNDEITLLKNQLKQKDEIISTLQKQANDLNNTLSKGELDFHFKEKKLQEDILSKTRRIDELKEHGQELAKGAQEEIEKLLVELETYHQQRKSNNNNEVNLNNMNNNNVVDENMGNLNVNEEVEIPNSELETNINSNMRSNSILSPIIQGSLLQMNTPENNSINFNNNMNNNINNVNFTDSKIQIYTLESENRALKEELMKKEEDLNFWKSIRENLNKNVTHSINRNDYYSTMKIQQLEKILFDYGKKINDLKNLYNRTLIEQRREKEELKRNYENNLTQMQNLNLNTNNLNVSNNIINIENTNNSMGNKSPSVNLSPQKIPTSPSNNNVNLNNILNTIPSATENTVTNSNYNFINNEEGMRNQFIQEKLESIKKNNPDI